MVTIDQFEKKSPQKSLGFWSPFPHGACRGMILQVPVEKTMERSTIFQRWIHYWKWPFIVDFPIKNCDCLIKIVIFYSYVSLPEGSYVTNYQRV